MGHLACLASASEWTFWPANEAKWEESNVANAVPKIKAMKNSSPVQGFWYGCEGRICRNDRESPEMRTFEYRALKIRIFRGLENRNVAKK